MLFPQEEERWYGTEWHDHEREALWTGSSGSKKVSEIGMCSTFIKDSLELKNENLTEWKLEKLYISSFTYH